MNKMNTSKITSPARSQGANQTPRRRLTRSSRSVGSPARSNVSGRLTSIITDSFAVSPLITKKSVLNDNTNIEEPRRESWWKKLNENSRDVIEVINAHNEVDANNVIEEYVDVLSQEKRNYTLDLPDSSDNESINSIVIPQRKLFTQKDVQAQKQFKEITGKRETLAKINKTNNDLHDKSVQVTTKNLFGHSTKRSRPIFPEALLNISHNKTAANKTKELVTAEVKGQVKTLFGNRPGVKRKNVFVDFIESGSEDEIPDIQPKIFAFPKKPKPFKRPSTSSRASSVATDIEMDDWNMLPSSTMVDHQLEDNGGEKADALLENDELRLHYEEEVEDDEPTLTELHNDPKEHGKINSSKDKSETTPKQSSYQAFEDIAETSTKTVKKSGTKNNLNKSIDQELMEVEQNYSKGKNKAENMNEQTIEKQNKHKDMSASKQKEYSMQVFVDEAEKTKAVLNKSHNKSTLNKSINQESIQEQNKLGQTNQIEVLQKNSEIVSPNSEKIEGQEQDNNDSEEKKQKELEEPIFSAEQKQNELKDQNNSEKGEQFHSVEEQVLESEKEQENESDEEEQNKSEEEEQYEAEEDAQNESVDEEKNKSEVAHNELKDGQNQLEEEQNESEKEAQNESVEEDENKSEVAHNESEEGQNQLQEGQNESEEEAQNESVEEEENKSEEVHNESEGGEQSNSEDEEQIDSEEQQTEQEVELSEQEQESSQAIEESEEIESDQDAVNHSDEQNETIDEQNQSEVTEDEDNTNENNPASDSENQEPNNSIIDSTHDTTGRNRKKFIDKSPEAVLQHNTEIEETFLGKGRNTSVRRTKSIIRDLNIKPSLAPVRESVDFSSGTQDSSAEGSGWDSHRTTRKTIRQTLGKDFSPRKSLRALVMEKSAKRFTTASVFNDDMSKLPQANSTELPDAVFEQSDVNIDSEEPVHEVSKRTRQATLENYLQSIKRKNIQDRLQMEEEVINSIKNPAEVPSYFKKPSKSGYALHKANSKSHKKQAKPKVVKSTFIPLEDLPANFLEDMNYKPPKRYKPGNAAWITKRLYNFLESKLEPKYDFKARRRAERLVENIYNFTKDTRRFPVAPQHAIDVLKKEMATLQVVVTHVDFYNFFHEYMPREIRVKVVPDIINKLPLPRNGVYTNIL